MTQPPPNPNLHPIFPLTWNPHKGNDYNIVDEDDSWEVRAFAEDTSSISGTTWPPRAYACSFCQREFRSAQALGGHMNVHRHDRARARLQLAPPPVSHGLRLVPPPYSCNYTGNPPPPVGFCLVCQHLGVPCNGVFVGVEAPVGGAAEPYHLLEPIRDVSVGGSESVGGDDKEAQVREVEVDLELRLGN